jgi:hypothetical protein
LATLAALAVLTCAAPAAADNPLQGRHYSVDVFQGPILASSDVIGIGGAYAAMAEGIGGMVVNAAAPAVREPYNVGYFSWDLSPGISIPLNLFGSKRDDFDNTGAAGHAYTDFLSLQLGGLLQYGPFGLGLSAEVQRFTIGSTASEGVGSVVTLGTYHALFAYSLLGGQLALGGGARMTSLSLAPQDSETPLTMLGAAPEFGIVIRPDWQSFRLGAGIRLPVNGGRFIGNVTPSATPGAPPTSGGLSLPDNVILPWEIEIGGAIQVGPRPLNPAWIDPHAQEDSLRRSFEIRREERRARQTRELAALGDPLERSGRRAEIEKEEATRAEQEQRDEERIRRNLEIDRKARWENWPREHVLVALELLMTGAVPNGVGLQCFLGQNQGDVAACGTGKSAVGTSGANVNFSPRAGVETEPLPGRVHTRVGTYYEPSRLGHPVGRQHFTFGGDVRVFKTTWFGLVPPVTYKVQAVGDFSARYQSLSLGVGVWH